MLLVWICQCSLVTRRQVQWWYLDKVLGDCHFDSSDRTEIRIWNYVDKGQDWQRRS